MTTIPKSFASDDATSRANQEAVLAEYASSDLPKDEIEAARLRIAAESQQEAESVNRRVDAILAKSRGKTAQQVADEVVAPVTYSVSGLPAGLSLDAATGKISGMPSAAGAFEIGHSRDSAEIRVPPCFREFVENRVVTVGKRVSFVLPQADDQDRSERFEYYLSLPSGLKFDPDTREVSGILEFPTVFSAEYVARNDRGERAYATFEIEARLPADDLTYSISATVDGKTVYGDDALPAGLRFDSKTGTISGIPETYADGTPFGSEAELHAGPIFIGTVPPVTVPAGRPTDIVLPEAVIDGSPVVYRIDEGSLPPGLSFDPETRRISGVPKSDGGNAAKIAYVAIDADGNAARVDFTITVVG